MSLRSKRLVLAAALLALALWPLAHRALVVHYRLTPWRFFGWAMYCAPRLPVVVSIQVDTGGGPVAVTGADNRRLRHALRRFTRRRGVWGRLARPDALAALALAAHPDGAAAAVTVERRFLDPTTARIAGERQTYTYRR